MIFEKNKDLKDLTTFHIPVKAKLFTEYSSLKELESIVKTEEFQNNRVFHIGGGSNLLFLEDFNGLVIHSSIKGIIRYDKNEDTAFIIAGAGEKWNDVVEFCLKNELSGSENLIGIPGEIGAAAIQNIGAYGVEFSDLVHNVECYDTREFKTVTLSREECEYGYRDSIFKNKEKGRYFILRVSLKLTKSVNASNITYYSLKELEKEKGDNLKINEVANKIKELRDSKLPDPDAYGNAGSFFKNPVVHRYFYKEVMQAFEPEIPFYETDNKEFIKIPAGWLIEKCGLKGFKIGGAEVYPKHCLVIINNGNATSYDVLKLAEKIQEEVSRKFGVLLEPEVNYIDTSMKIIILGSGTSKGIPEIGCRCKVCESNDPKDKRNRCSALVETMGLRLLIDVSPDFRQQFLKEQNQQLDCALITHSHYDHVGGIDDLRPFCIKGKFPLYVKEDVKEDLMRRLDYCFSHHLYPGVPTFDVNIVDDRPFYIKGQKIIPIKVMHGPKEILGYRINDFAYITDAKTIDERELEKLYGLKVLVINALRDRSHFSHFSLSEALEMIELLKPERAYLTHFNHEIGLHSEIEKRLPKNVYPCFDGLEITV